MDRSDLLDPAADMCAPMPLRRRARPGTMRYLSGRLNYAEGDWFAVPLRDGGYAVGLVARASRGGVLLGYFFGPRLADVPVSSDISEVRPDDAVLVKRFGHLGLTQGTWTVIGQLASWDRTAWPVPAFVRYEELTGRSFRVVYDPDDPNRVLREERITPGVAEQGAKDGMAGAGAVEVILTKLLAP